jgi:hypothetical protein
VVKYFVVVCPWHRYGLSVLVTVTALGLVSIWLNSSELDSGLGMVLFVQMFAASSGFVVTARRGHYDAVLVHGSSRTAALAAEWIAAVAPGVVAWLTLAVTGCFLGSPAATSALMGDRLAAFFVVSAVSWAIGCPLPRGAGGALWMGLLLALMLRRADFAAPLLGSSPLAVARAAGSILVCPFLLLGGRDHTGAAVGTSVAAAFFLLLAAWRLGSRADVFLVERS